MATSFPVLCSFLFFILTHWTSPSVSGPQEWWPPHGKLKVMFYWVCQDRGPNWVFLWNCYFGTLLKQNLLRYSLKTNRMNVTRILQVKCPYRKDFSSFRVTMNPCISIYQPICGTNMVTYDNPCTLCIESLKSHGKVRFLHDGAC